MSGAGLARRAASIAAVASAASLAMYAGACGPAETQGTQGAQGAPGGGPSIEGVIYEGGANDEALVLLLEKQAASDDARGTVFDAPTSGAVLPSDAAPTFAWHVGAAKGAELAPARARPEATRGASAWAAIRELVGPTRAAMAHGPPVNGRAYFLEVTTKGGVAVARVFTTLLEYTPDDVVWSAMKASGEPLTATIVSAIFENNRIAEDGGPFEGQPASFSVMK